MTFITDRQLQKLLDLYTTTEGEQPLSTIELLIVSAFQELKVRRSNSPMKRDALEVVRDVVLISAGLCACAYYLLFAPIA